MGYKGYLIKEYFANYFLHTADVTIDLRRGSNGMEVHHARSEPWRITLVETGATTMTGGRLAAIRPYLDPEEPFCFIYGDGVADIDVGDLVRFHKAYGRVLVTGHTGFKGSWLALWLSAMGARVTGYALPAPTQPSLFAAARIDQLVDHVEGDVRDLAALRATVAQVRPEVIFHLAAQSLVRLSGRNLRGKRDGHGASARSGADGWRGEGDRLCHQRQML